ncbi:MAG: hypothetical protein OXC62_03695 [Aestuariivita sp.]|nr:hypothetical protein [Aestuariivita sp.]
MSIIPPVVNQIMSEEAAHHLSSTENALLMIPCFLKKRTGSLKKPREAHVIEHLPESFVRGRRETRNNHRFLQGLKGPVLTHPSAPINAYI